METFKLIVAAIISPLIIALMIQGVGWILWLRKRRRTAIIVIASGFAVLLIGSLPVLSSNRNRDREYMHPPLDPAALASDQPVLAVVLGTGFNPDPYLPPNSQASASFHARFIEGVRVFRSHPDVRLLVSVAGKRDEADKRKYLAAMVEILALDSSRVELIADAESTADEASLVKVQLKGEQLVVVTSAGHMPRAIQTFRKEAMEPVPAPADFHAARKGNPHAKPWKNWIPSSGGIGGNRQMIYEWMASIWNAMGGK